MRAVIDRQATSCNPTQPREAATADRRLAPLTNRIAAAAATTTDNTKKTTIQTKLSIMTIGLRSTSQFGSQATTMKNGITAAVGSNVASASAFQATKTARNTTAAAGISAFQIGKPLKSPPKNCRSESQARSGLSM